MRGNILTFTAVLVFSLIAAPATRACDKCKFLFGVGWFCTPYSDHAGELGHQYCNDTAGQCREWGTECELQPSDDQCDTPPCGPFQHSGPILILDGSGTFPGGGLAMSRLGSASAPTVYNRGSRLFLRQEIDP